MKAVGLRSDHEPDRHRARNPGWWRRRLRKILFHAVEMTHVRISPTKLQLVSNDARDRFKHLRQAAKDWASRTSLRNKATGKMISGALIDPDEIDRRKHAEFINVSTGMCALGNARGLDPHLITITLPSEWNPTKTIKIGTSEKRIRNPGWNRLPLIRGHQKLMARWARFRTWMSHQSDLSDLMWQRSVQPHQSGSIHWHLTLWLPKDRERSGIILDKLIEYMRPDINPDDEHQADIGVTCDLLHNPEQASKYIDRMMGGTLAEQPVIRKKQG